MNEATLHDKTIKVGDEVWDSKHGWGPVIELDIESAYSVITGYDSYTKNGRKAVDDKYPSLFWKEQTFDLSKPLPDLKMDDPIRVWNDEDHKYIRHFCYFNKNGKISAFDDGKTSWTAEGKMSTWDNWELVIES